MGFTIEDGLTGKTASITTKGNRLKTDSSSGARAYFISRDNGDTYSITARATAAAGEYHLYFMNTSTTKKFYVKSIRVGSAVLATFKITKVTGTAGGAGAIPITNLNMTSGNTAEADATGNAAVTGLTPGDVIEDVSVTAADSKVVNFDDALIIGKGDAIALEYDTGAGGAIHATMQGFFEED